MNELEIPKIGQRVRVYTKYSIAWMNEYNRPIEGTVAPSDSWHNPNSFHLHPSNQGLPSRISNGHSIISFDRVARIEYLDSTQDAQTQEIGPVDPLEDASKPQYFQVEGSKGANYTVTKLQGKYTCNCIAGGFGRECKHVAKIKQA